MDEQERIRGHEPISGTLVRESRFSVPDTFFSPRERLPSDQAVGPCCTEAIAKTSI